MNDMVSLGQIIKEKRLADNLTMNHVAKEAGITRATLWAIEKGQGKCSVRSLFRILEILDIRVTFETNSNGSSDRLRATRINKASDKKVNRFIVMCVEQYASFINKDSSSTYKLMNERGIIDEMEKDYEDLHGMSNLQLMDYISSLMEEETK